MFGGKGKYFSESAAAGSHPRVDRIAALLDMRGFVLTSILATPPFSLSSRCATDANSVALHSVPRGGLWDRIWPQGENRTRKGFDQLLMVNMRGVQKASRMHIALPATDLKSTDGQSPSVLTDYGRGVLRLEW